MGKAFNGYYQFFQNDRFSFTALHTGFHLDSTLHGFLRYLYAHLLSLLLQSNQTINDLVEERLLLAHGLKVKSEQNV